MYSGPTVYHTIHQCWLAALKGSPDWTLLEWVIQQHLHAGLDERGHYQPYPFPHHQLEFQLRQLLTRVYEHLSLEELAWMRLRKSIGSSQALHEYIIWLICSRARILFADQQDAPAWLKELNLKRLRLIYRKKTHRPYQPWVEYVWRGCLEI